MNKREIVASCQVVERLPNPGNHLHGTLQNPLRKAHHRPQIVVANLPLHQVLVALRQIAAEVQRAIPMDPGVRPFDLIQNVAHLLRPQRRMSQKHYKFLERTFEVNVVLPQRIVGIDNQVLAGH